MQLKEMEEVDDYSKMFQADRRITVKPADGELSYGAFVAALIKVCSIRHQILTGTQKVMSKRDFEDNKEYSLVD